MLDVFDFLADKGGDPKKVKASQRRRHAPEEAVDETIALYEDARKCLVTKPAILISNADLEASKICYCTGKDTDQCNPERDRS